MGGQMSEGRKSGVVAFVLVGQMSGGCCPQ